MKTIDAFYLGKNECILSLILGYIYNDFMKLYNSEDYPEETKHEISKLLQQTMKSIQLLERSRLDSGLEESQWDSLERMATIGVRLRLVNKFNEMIEFFPEYKKVEIINFNPRNNIVVLPKEINIEINYI